MYKEMMNLSVKAFIVGISFAVGALATTAIAVTVSATFTSGDTLTAASMNVIKSAIESIPDWAKSGGDTVYTAGNVGIGTASPTANLHIENATAPHIMMNNTTTAASLISLKNTDGRLILCKNNDTGATCITGGAAYAGVVSMETNDPLQFGTNDVPRMTILGDGKVGIGTTTPEFNFEIKSSSGSANMALERASNIYGANIRLQTNSTNDWLIGQNGTSTSDLNIYSYGTSNEVMTILRSNGNVGIGTTTPGAKLAVVGLTAYVDDAAAAVALSTGDLYTITGSTAVHVVP